MFVSRFEKNIILIFAIDDSNLFVIDVVIILFLVCVCIVRVYFICFFLFTQVLTTSLLYINILQSVLPDPPVQSFYSPSITNIIILQSVLPDPPVQSFYSPGITNIIILQSVLPDPPVQSFYSPGITNIIILQSVLPDPPVQSFYSPGITIIIILQSVLPDPPVQSFYSPGITTTSELHRATKCKFCNEKFNHAIKLVYHMLHLHQVSIDLLFCISITYSIYLHNYQRGKGILILQSNNIDSYNFGNLFWNTKILRIMNPPILKIV